MYTRHNAGFLTADAIADRLQVRFRRRLFHPYASASHTGPENTEHLIVKPLTFMNSSGKILPELFARTGCEASDIILICDNMDIPPGDIRIKQKGSAAGHNGIASIMEYAGTGAFIRVYIGVGRPKHGESVIDHVLGVPSDEDARRMNAAIDHAAECIIRIMQGQPLVRVMNDYARTGHGPEDL